MEKQLVTVLFLLIITASWCKAQNPTLLGMTSYGGKPNEGTIFKTDTASAETDLSRGIFYNCDK